MLSRSGQCRSSRGCWQVADRKSTRLNSSHRCISYAVFCLKKKIFGLPLPPLAALLERFFAASDSRGDKFLDHERERQLWIGRHPLDNIREFFDVVMRSVYT